MKTTNILMSAVIEPEVEELLDVDISELLTRKIVVYNDDHNSFEHVIECFCRILQHTEEQAFQCALIIHNHGRTPVKEGEFDKLKPLKEALCEEGLDARIE